jgi:hypothetical protein
MYLSNYVSVCKILLKVGIHGCTVLFENKNSVVDITNMICDYTYPIKTFERKKNLVKLVIVIRLVHVTQYSRGYVIHTCYNPFPMSIPDDVIDNVGEFLSCVKTSYSHLLVVYSGLDVSYYVQSVTISNYIKVNNKCEKLTIARSNLYECNLLFLKLIRNVIPSSKKVKHTIRGTITTMSTKHVIREISGNVLHLDDMRERVSMCDTYSAFTIADYDRFKSGEKNYRVADCPYPCFFLSRVDLVDKKKRK